MKGAIHSLIFTCISFSLVYRFVVADVVVVDDDDGGGGIITVDVIQFLYISLAQGIRTCDTMYIRLK